MASVIRLVVNARDNSRAALNSVGGQFRDIGRRINDSLRDSTRGIGDRFRNLGQNINDRMREGVRNLPEHFRNTAQRIRRDFVGELRAIPGGFRTAMRASASAMRDTGRSFGRFFSQALNGEIGSAFSAAASNPIVLAAIVALATAAASFVGAAIAGALILALGGGITALGVMIVAKSKETKEAWKKTLAELKPLFADAASPLKPVVEEARKAFASVAEDFAPHFKDAMTEAAPHLTTFIDSLKKGLRKLGEGAWDDLMESFNVFLVAFGPQFEDFLKEFGESLGALARTVSNHSEEIAMALRGVLGIINFLVDAVNFFANVWVFALRTSAESIGTFIAGVGMMADAVLSAVDSILSSIESVASVIGMEGPVKRARENFNRMREGVRRDFDDMSRKFSDWGKNLDLASRKRKLEVDIASWTARIEDAKRQLSDKNLPPKKRAKLEADIRDLSNKVATAKRELNSIRDKSVSVGVSLYLSPTAWDRDANGVPDAVQSRATGGPIGAAATGGVRSNLVMVGERGPEVVNLPAGSHVRSNGDTRRMLAGGGGNGQPLVVQFLMDGKLMASAMIDPLKGEIINRSGGNVQAALGKG